MIDGPHGNVLLRGVSIVRVKLGAVTMSTITREEIDAWIVCKIVGNYARINA